jgi:hypothetical protein
MAAQRRPDGCTTFCAPKTNTVVTPTSTRRQLFPRMIEAHRQHRAGVPAQRRHAVAGVCVPELNGAVTASTCQDCAVFVPGDGVDTAFAMRLVSTRSNSGEGRKLDGKKKSHHPECPLNGDPICVPVSASQIRIERSPFPPYSF